MKSQDSIIKARELSAEAGEHWVIRVPVYEGRKSLAFVVVQALKELAAARAVVKAARALRRWRNEKCLRCDSDLDYEVCTCTENDAKATGADIALCLAITAYDAATKETEK